MKQKKMKNFGGSNTDSGALLILISIVSAFFLWFLLTRFKYFSAFLSSPEEVVATLISRLESGYFWPDVIISLQRIFKGYFIGMLTAIPVAFLMGWYRPLRSLVEPWIQFLRTIPPIAYIPIMVVAFGVGEDSKVAIIALASFLACSITVMQGILETDATLIKAAFTFGANDADLFLYVVLPASTPYIMIAARTALAGSFTTLIAAEMTGATAGLGARIQLASSAARIDLVILCILVIGVLGFIFDRILLHIEKIVTRWK
ncbi:MAG: ABC transporter permease [Faecalibacterium sp.]